MSSNLFPKVVLVVMGVSGCGKSTIAGMLAKALSWPVEEGDALHPQANIDKMSRGIPLNDDDRRPWLQAIARAIDNWRATAGVGIITCSALKRAYRDLLVTQRPDVWFVYLKGSKELIRERIAKRSGHFMPPDLLDSQFAALEEPTADERAIVVDVSLSPDAIVETILGALRRVADNPQGTSGPSAGS